MVRKTVIVMLAFGTLATAAFWSWRLIDDLGPEVRGFSAHLGCGVYLTHEPDADWFRLGFGGYPQDKWKGRGIRSRLLRFEYGPGCVVLDTRFWIVIPLLGIYPAIAFVRGPVWRWRKRRRHRRGECLACGYNLTGNVSGVCSECGADVEC